MRSSHKDYLLRARLACCAAVAIILVGSCHNRMHRVHPDFSSNPYKVRNIAVLQPNIDAVERSFFAPTKHADNPNEYYSKTRATLAESLTALLELNGFTAHLVSESEMQDTSHQKVLSVGNEISEHVFSKKNGENNELLRLGSLHPFKYPFSGNLPVDAFLYSSYRRWCNSKMTGITQQALLIAIASAGRTSPSGVSGCGVDVDVILIRSTTGEVLWANRASSKTLITELVAETAMKKFPVIKTAISK